MAGIMCLLWGDRSEMPLYKNTACFQAVFLRVGRSGVSCPLYDGFILAIRKIAYQYASIILIFGQIIKAFAPCVGDHISYITIADDCFVAQCDQVIIYFERLF